jgi:hypothetical protein
MTIELRGDPREHRGHRDPLDTETRTRALSWKTAQEIRSATRCLFRAAARSKKVAPLRGINDSLALVPAR